MHWLLTCSNYYCNYKLKIFLLRQTQMGMIYMTFNTKKPLCCKLNHVYTYVFIYSKYETLSYGIAELLLQFAFLLFAFYCLYVDKDLVTRVKTTHFHVADNF